MKKILFGIITILGIGLSFCSSEDWYFLSSNLNGQWNSAPVQDDTFNQLYFNTNYSYVSLDSICISYRNYFGYFPSTAYAVVGLGDGNYYYSDSFYISTGPVGSDKFYLYCFPFSDFIVENNQIIYFGFHYDSPAVSTGFFVDLPSLNSFVRLSIRGKFSYSNGFFSPISGLYIGYNSKSNPEAFLFGVSFSEAQISPKFKVNYGNTSYEYELSDNLEIYLKSPVSMSGSYNYIYDGPTGINLFYNNTSDFYNKDKLYLKSVYWYNKNIFTPICL